MYAKKIINYKLYFFVEKYFLDTMLDTYTVDRCFNLKYASWSAFEVLFLRDHSSRFVLSLSQIVLSLSQRSKREKISLSLFINSVMASACTAHAARRTACPRHRWSPQHRSRPNYSTCPACPTYRGQPRCRPQ